MSRPGWLNLQGPDRPAPITFELFAAVRTPRRHRLATAAGWAVGELERTNRLRPSASCRTPVHAPSPEASLHHRGFTSSNARQRATAMRATRVNGLILHSHDHLMIVPVAEYVPTKSARTDRRASIANPRNACESVPVEQVRAGLLDTRRVIVAADSSKGFAVTSLRRAAGGCRRVG
jgi:hypothetical protein